VEQDYHNYNHYGLRRTSICFSG